jgi:hypothetical protein
MNKNQAQALIQSTFETAFNEGGYTRFLRELFNGQMDESDDRKFDHYGQYIPDAFKEHVRRYKRLGTYTDPNGNEIDLLWVILKREASLEQARTMQRNFAAYHLKRRDKETAIIAYTTEEREDWRFSMVRREPSIEFNEQGKLVSKEHITPVRRYSFLVGKGEGSHTAQQQLLPILVEDQHDPTLDGLEGAFNIETVTKEFFERYKMLFLQLKEELDRLTAKDSHIQAEFEAKGIDSANFAKKLLGQIVFLYFLQKKGWLGVRSGDNWGTGPKNFLRQLFHRDGVSYDNFFNDVLEPLFYEALALERPDNLYSRLNVRIPFLNGGLFEPMNNYDWHNVDILIDNGLFEAIFETFDLYNFTVREDEPLEKEVAIDPEMLGKVFERLLEVTDRKSKGAFYTPREIVHYMCQESLINYLSTTMDDAITRDDLVTFIRLGEFTKEHDTATHNKEKETTAYSFRMPESIRTHATKLDDALAGIKICDPAIGSGAFPVGMMQEIVKAREVLTAYLGQHDTRTTYHFKRHAIQESIYGVDIDPSAIDIAKLRLWLSLVVDEDNYHHIKPLPNLDYKIVCGNSLLSIQHDLFNDAQFKKLEALKTAYFDETNPQEKLAQRAQIDALIAELTGGHRQFDMQIYFSEVFHHNGGFDVVIGNPPYLESRSAEFLDEVKDLLQVSVKARWQIDAKFITRGADLLIYFFETAIFNIHKQGQVVFITQNSWLDTEYGSKFQHFLIKHTFVEAIIDSDYKYFDQEDGPNINTVISIFRGKEPLNQQITFARFKDRYRNISSLIFDTTNNSKIPNVEYYRYSYSDQMLINMKWGILLTSPVEFLYLLEILKQHGTFIENIKSAKLSIGQGLNLTKDFFIQESEANKLNLPLAALIPFITSSDGAHFEITQTQYFLIDAHNLSEEAIKRLKEANLKPFNRNSTRKTEPKLVLPRGIGRHFCAINTASAFSASYVDIYDASETPSEEIMLNLWLFLNSSIAWLIREISGRKNLGGGMLKAEAVDLKTFPIYMNFDRLTDIKLLRHALQNREALDTLSEIETPEHKKIDQIVFDHLDIDHKHRIKIIALLKEKVLKRIEKSKT